MSNPTKRKVPAIRFKGFEGEWEEKRFGELVLIQRGGSPRPIEAFITQQLNGINWVKIGDVSPDSRYINKTQDKIKPEGTYKSRWVFKGDLILSNSMSFGRPYIMNIDGCIHDGWLLIRNDKKIFDLEFLLQLLSTEQMLAQYRELASGGVVNNLNSALVQSTTVSFPSLPEQAQIGNFFKHLDTNLAQHQTKLTKLQNLKQAMLQKMFPQDSATVPEIRFKGFREEWEERRLGDLGSLQSGVGFPEHEQGNKEGIPFFKVSDMSLLGNESIMLAANNYVIKEQINRRRWSTVSEVPAIIFAKVGAAIFLNRKRLVNTPFLIDNNMMCFSFGKQLSAFYAKSLFETIYLPEYAQVGALPSFNARDIEQIKVATPSLPEQQKIGSYFRKLDELIALEQNQLEKLKQIKSAALEGMFV